MLIDYKLGQTSIVLRVKLLDSSVATGAGKTGLSSSSAGLIISTIADNEATATAYTQAGGTIDTVTTLGTYAAPTATHCRFREVDSTNHKGVYEIQLADARFGVTSAKSLLVSISGVSGVAESDFIVGLRSVDPYDGVRAGLTALPNAAAGAAGGVIGAGTGSNQLSVASGQVLVQSGTGAGQLSVTSGVVSANVTQNAGSAITSSGGRQEVNVTHFGGVAATTSGGVPSVNAVQWRGTQPNALVSGRVDASAGAVATGTITNGAFAADAIDSNAFAATAAAEIVAAVKAMVVESNGSVTLGQAVSVMLAALCGVTTGGGNTFKDPSGTTTRISATIDGSNNRTTMALSPSS